MKKFQTQVVKCGDDYFIPISEDMLNSIGLSLGDSVDVSLINGSILIKNQSEVYNQLLEAHEESKTNDKRYSHKEVFQEMREIVNNNNDI